MFDGSALPQFESAREFNIGARNLTLQVPSLNPENADPIWEFKELRTSNVILARIIFIDAFQLVRIHPVNSI